jgi:hypothetical protein
LCHAVAVTNLIAPVNYEESNTSRSARTLIACIPREQFAPIFRKLLLAYAVIYRLFSEDTVKAIRSPSDEWVGGPER